MSEISIHLPWPFVSFGAGVGMMYAVQKFFKTIESNLHPTTKKQIADWLLKTEPHLDLETWPHTFEALFETIFGNKYISAKFIAASLIATVSAVVLAQLGILASSKELFDWNQYFSGYEVRFLLSVILLNAVPDMAGLMETRLTIRLMKTHRRRFLILIADLVFKSLLAVIFVAPMFSLVQTLFFGDSHANVAVFIKREVRIVLAMLTSLLALFFSSIWLWLYFIAGSIVSAINRAGNALRFFRKHLDIEHKPLQSIGLITGILVAVIYWVLVGLAHVFI